MDDIELDNERHRREEQERRAKRQKNRETKSKSGHLSEKERKRREHAQRILGAQKKRQSSSSTHSQYGGVLSSVFQSLFHERAEGFFIDLRFRNAPPRPPVGPTFVGLGLEGELTNKWTKYKARNAVENQYTWKLHPDRDLGVPLAVSAMDYEMCYSDIAKKNNVKRSGDSGDTAHSGQSLPSPLIPAIHPEDEVLIHWRGNSGDTASEQLQQKQDKVRAAARLAIAQGHGAMPYNASGNMSMYTSAGGLCSSNGSAFRLKKHHLQSRILDEKTPNFMKKTTYLTNDATSVHRFTSLAHTQVQRARDVDQALAETKTKYTELDIVVKGFRQAHSMAILPTSSAEATDKNSRTHPSKKDVHPVWDLPLLPDIPMWGHTYTHVVLDNPPKNMSSKAATLSKAPSDEMPTANKNSVHVNELDSAVVADVTKQTQNARMACTLWVKKSCKSPQMEHELKSADGTKKNAREGDMYLALQEYDLDVVPLRDPSTPPVHYVWIVDPLKNYVGYHCVGSRVQLSTGRPVVVSGKPFGADEVGIPTDESFIKRRSVRLEEGKNIEIRMADVDMSLAEKYGLTAGAMKHEGGLASDIGSLKHGRANPESDSDSIAVDAF